MKFERRFTTAAGQETYDKIPFRSASSEIRNPDGTVVFSAENIEVPEQYSQVATDILAQKYFRKAGVAAQLKRVEEMTCPHGYGGLYLTLRRLKSCQKTSVTAERHQQNRSLTGWSAPGPIGHGKRAISPAKTMPEPIMMR